MSAHVDVLRDIIEEMEKLEHEALASLRSEGQPDAAHEAGERAEEDVKNSPEAQDAELGEPADLKAMAEGGVVDPDDDEMSAGESGDECLADRKGADGKTGAGTGKAEGELEESEEKAREGKLTTPEGQEQNTDDEDGKKAREIASRMFRKRGQ